MMFYHRGHHTCVLHVFPDIVNKAVQMLRYLVPVLHYQTVVGYTVAAYHTVFG